MYDRGLSVLEQYGLEASAAYRGRGSLICETQKGLVAIREFGGSPQKLEKQAQLLETASAEGPIKLDVPIKNQEGQYVSFDKDNIGYYVKHWHMGRECDTHSQEDILRSVRILAALHQMFRMPWEEKYAREDLCDEYVRHNRELKKIQKYIRSKRQKNAFESKYLKSVDWFLQKGEEVAACLQCSGYEKLRMEASLQGQICHGEFNQHNVVLLEGEDAVINADKWHFDVQLADLYQFVRKIMEKNNWDSALGQLMIQEYDRVIPLSDEGCAYLRLRFAYPEKYWKLANHYYVGKKALVSQKDVEKLEHIIGQKENWQAFAILQGKDYNLVRKNGR